MSSRSRIAALLGAVLVLPAADCGNLGSVVPLLQLTVRASVRADAGETVGGANPRITDDGRYVFFDSAASDLVTGDANGKRDVFMKDRLTGLVELVTKDNLGFQLTKDSTLRAISGDGNFVLYHYDPPLPTDPVTAHGMLWVRDRAGATTRPVIDPADVFTYELNGGAISDDGLSVVFTTYSNDLSGYTNSPQFFQVLLSDLSFNPPVLRLVSSTTALGTTGGNNYSSTPDITADGQTVVFESQATNLQGVGTDGTYDVFLWARATGVLSVVSRTAGGVEADGHCTNPTVSADGRYVAFETTAPNLDPMRVAVRDRGDAAAVPPIPATTVSAYDEPYLGGLVLSVSPRISRGGRHVVFHTASSLLDGPGNGITHVFRRDLGTGGVVRASINNLGDQAEASAANGVVSFDGSWVVWQSFADNLVQGDANTAIDVFIRGPFP
jgi:Tol biopolymer transport system component